MDAWTDDEVETIVFKKPSQVGATAIMLNCIGHVIDVDPGPTLMIQPTLEMAGVFSKDRLAPMLRDSPCLRGRVADRRSKDSDNTILHKAFDGGHLSIAGANSAAGLASRPIRYLFGDEVNRYPISAGSEGDPISLGEKRQASFWNRKRFYASSPTIKGRSRINALYELSDKCRLWLPCPECGEFQLLLWAGLVFDRDDAGDLVEESVRYPCEFCRFELRNEHKSAMLAGHEWRPSAPFNGVRGFHMNELYSPWVPWSTMAKDFLDKKGDPDTLKTFVNTALAEEWEDQTDRLKSEDLKARAEPCEMMPVEVWFVTAGVDIQDDRIEIELLGWGNLYESWSLEHLAIYGDPQLGPKSPGSPWKDLDEILLEEILREDGRSLRVSAACIDSGHLTESVYRFCKPRFARRVYAIKGAGGGAAGTPIPGRLSRNNRLGCPVFSQVNVDEAKDLVFRRLGLTEPGPGYCHFPEGRDEEYYLQLASEERIEKYVRGQLTRAYRQVRTRNEALDLRVYNTVACEILAPNWQALAVNMAPLEEPPEPDPEPPSGPSGRAADAKVGQNRRQPRRRSGWMSKRTRR